MPVSAGLQKYFDSKRGQKDDIRKKLTSISHQIDPAFMQSFEAFHDKIMKTVEETSEAEDIIVQELGDLDMSLQKSKRKHDMQKAATIIELSEQA